MYGWKDVRIVSVQTRLGVVGELCMLSLSRVELKGRNLENFLYHETFSTPLSLRFRRDFAWHGILCFFIILLGAWGFPERKGNTGQVVLCLNGE